MNLIMKKNTFFLLFLLGCTAISCNNFGQELFSKKTAREAYEDKLEKQNPVVQTAWDKAGEFAVQHPFILTDSYAEFGKINTGIADANAYSIELKPGQRLTSFYTHDGINFPAFLDLFSNDGIVISLVASADTVNNMVSYWSTSGGNYIVKFQPKVEAKGNFNLTIQLEAGLGFPIDPVAKPSIGSLWGDPRDGGARKHEGIDIFAARGSKILAGADGVIGYVDETDIGGKVISLRPKGYNISLYHAHLDEQLVTAGQSVKKGQVIGTVGNTGNAKTTAPHLHFGIYGNGGAVDPLYFVKKAANPSPAVTKKLNDKLEFSSSNKLYPGPSTKNPYAIKGNFVATTQGYGKGFYRVVLENGSKGYVREVDLRKASNL